MKNLVLTLFIALTAFSTIDAQRMQKKAKTFTEKSLYELTAEINNTVNSKMTTEQKNKLVIKTIKNYLMTSQADEIMTNSPCENTKTVKYIKEMKVKNFKQVPSSYIAKNGKMKNSCEFSQAVQIYNLVGHELVTSDNICSIMGCDDIVDSKNPTKMAPITTSKKPTWKYTGVRRYFIEKEKFGWRYLCIETNAKGKVILSDEVIQQAIEELEISIALAEESGKPIDNSALPIPFKKHKLSWKLDNQVDIW